MYCKRGLDCFLLKSKITSGRDLKKLLNASTLSSLEASFCLKPLSNTIKNSNYPRLQGGITFSSLSQNRNVQTSGVYFPRRCKNAFPEDVVTTSSSTYEKPVPFEDLASRLIKCSSVQEQMEELCRVLSLTPENMKRREELCLHIEEMLSPFFKNLRVQMFGSSTNGFGFKGCDIDISLKIIGDKRKLVISRFEDPDIPSVHDVVSGKVSVEYLAKLPQKEQLLFVNYVLDEYYKESSQPVIFINAYVPILRFYHDKYGLKCDLAFSNSTAFSNTRLLKLCGLLDERVTLLMMTIRYWAKHIELIGKGLAFNSYTISLLILYFLQTRKPPVLPPVEHLLSISEYLTNDDMDDDSYLQDLKKIPPSENKQTAVELLKEFFYFYLYFDFMQVICPLTASSVSRTAFLARQKNFRVNTICIQDPIKLSHNVANLVDYDYCKKFLFEVLTVVKLFHEENLWLPSSSNWGILSLFEKPENYSPTLSSDHLLSLQIFSIPVSPEETGVVDCPDKDTKKAWFQKISRIVLSVLEYALLFECKVEENSERHSYSQSHLNQNSIAEEENQTLTVGDQHQHTLKASSSEVASSIQLKGFPSFSINCVAYKNTWLGREDLEMKTLPDSLYDPLETERTISLKLLRERKGIKKDDKALFSFICECYELDYGKQTSLLIKLKPFQKENFHPILGLFLKDYVPRTANRILKALMNNCRRS